jgi:diketogulonate reductase-like aldo/keto reductase
MEMPRLGMGTWHMGESAGDRAAEVAALRQGLELGLTLIDTAEMYGDGGAEAVVGEAIRGRREGLYIVSKFYPHHAAPRDLLAACERSRRRLGVDTIDCYLYHWRGPVPLAQTVPVLNELVDAGHIARWGVSNFDVADIEELFAIPGGERCAANQVLYNLARRGIEYDLLPWCAGRHIDVMAYSPLDEGPLARHPAVVAVAKRMGIKPAQVAIAWLLRHPSVAVIPKASNPLHVADNAACRGITLDGPALAALDAAFPPPRTRRPLEVI